MMAKKLVRKALEMLRKLATTEIEEGEEVTHYCCSTISAVILSHFVVINTRNAIHERGTNYSHLNAF